LFLLVVTKMYLNDNESVLILQVVLVWEALNV